MTTKRETVTATLIYPSSLCDRPHVAEAIVKVRLTPKQIVVETQSNPEIVYVNGHTRGPTGIGAKRYWRRNGFQVGGHWLLRTWRLAPGELERLNCEASEREAKR